MKKPTPKTATTQTVTLQDIKTASQLIHQVGRTTPLIQSMFLSKQIQGQVFLKLENMQLTGSFKFRGSFNKIQQLSKQQRQKGIITASAGNHAQGVALTAQLLGIKAVVVMPNGAPLAKQAATKSYGAQVVLHGDNFDEARAFMEAKAAQDGMTIVDPYNDPAVIAGQGSIGLELLNQLPHVDTVIVPVGGGGLIAGVATALKAVNPAVHIIGVQSRRVHGMAASLRKGEITRNKAVAILWQTGQRLQFLAALLSRLHNN